MEDEEFESGVSESDSDDEQPSSEESEYSEDDSDVIRSKDGTEWWDTLRSHRDSGVNRMNYTPDPTNKPI